MSSGKTTTNHDEIRKWAEERGGRPAVVAGTGGMLRLDFNEQDAKLEPISWEDFFQKFDESKLEFLYGPDKDSRFFKFIQQPGTNFKAGDHTPVPGHEQEAKVSEQKHKEWEKKHPDQAKAYAQHEQDVQKRDEERQHRAEHKDEHRAEHKAAHKGEHAAHKGEHAEHKSEHEEKPKHTTHHHR